MSEAWWASGPLHLYCWVVEPAGIRCPSTTKFAVLMPLLGMNLKVKLKAGVFEPGA